MGSHGNLPRVGTRCVDTGIEGGPGAPQGLQRQPGDGVRQAGQAAEFLMGQVAQGGDELGAVDEGQALLGLEDHGLETRCRQGRAPGHLVAVLPGQPLAHQQKGHVGQGSQVAAGAHAALAGHHGHHILVQAVCQQADGLGADAAVALQQTVDASGHEGAGLVLRKRVAHARGMAADEVQLEQLQLVRCDDHRGELAEARVDAVDRAALGHDAVHHPPILGHHSEGGLVQDHGFARGDARQQRGGEGLSIEADHTASLGLRVRASTRARPRVRPATV